MIAVCDNKEREIGQFDGRFVYDLTGERLYWIDDGEVFSLPSIHRAAEPGDRSTIRIAVLTNKAAIDDNGAIIFKLQQLTVYSLAMTAPESEIR